MKKVSSLLSEKWKLTSAHPLEGLKVMSEIPNHGENLDHQTHFHSCPLSWWCHPTISSSFIPFSCLQFFPASGSFQTIQFFTSGGQSIGVSASASVLQMNIQDWFPLGCTDWISLQSKGLSRVFSNTTVQKHQLRTHPISAEGSVQRVCFAW